METRQEVEKKEQQEQQIQQEAPTITPGRVGYEEPATNISVAMDFKLRIKDGSTAGRFIQFSAIPTSFSMTSAVGEVIAANISFEVNGAPTDLAL